MGKIKDLTGIRFGKLTVIKNAENKNNRTYWLCKCDCKRKTTVRSDLLVDGRIDSCPDCGRDLVRIKLIGNIYGFLKVIKRLKDKGRSHWWLCECLNCGNKNFKIAGSRLINSKIEDCGCVLKVKNKYDLNGEYGIGYTKKGEEFYFDLDDYEKIKGFTWCISTGYVMSNPNHKMIQMHRIITNITDVNIKIDHVNRKRNDNRKENLRIANSFQNIWNMSISKNNTSGVIGVSWSNTKNAWISIIGVNYKTIYLLETKDFDDAVKARLLAEKQYFGEFAPQKHLYREYGIE